LELVELVCQAVAKKQHLFAHFDKAAIQQVVIEQHNLLSRIKNFFRLNA